jgi:hypothetical protein
LGSLTSFIIGVLISNFYLWLIGLIFILTIEMVMVCSAILSMEKSEGRYFPGLEYGFFLIFLYLFNIIVSCVFIILGLLMSITLFWIVGISVIVFSALSFFTPIIVEELTFFK